MRALVTGITGFVGGHLAEHLLAQGDAVLGISRSGILSPDLPAEVHQRVQLVRWDLAKQDPPPEVAAAIQAFQPDCIYHLAAMSIPRDCGHDQPSPQALAANVDGTARIVQLAISLADPAPKLLYTSSSHVYPPATIEAYRFAETSPLGPEDGYGKTKVMAEQLVQQAIKDSGLAAVISRSFQHTGPRQIPRLMLPEWTEQFVRGVSPVQVHSRDIYLDVTDVRDTVRAYRLLIEQGQIGQPYNVGSGIRRRTGDILKILQEAADPTRPIQESKPGQKQDPVADPTLLKQTTGWQPQFPIEQTVADTLAYWRKRVAAE